MKKTHLVVLTFISLLILTGAADLFGQRRGGRPAAIRAQARVPAAANAETRKRLEAFETVWQTIYLYYFDRTFNNVSWEKVRAEYEPLIRRAKTDTEVHDLLAGMIGKLRVSHLAIIPPEVYTAIENAKARAKEREDRRALREAAGAEGDDEDEEDESGLFDDPLAHYGIGADVRIIDNRLVITRLARDSAAEYAGLKLGYVIESVNDVSISDLLMTVELLDRDNDRVKRFLPLEIIANFLNGEKDSRITIGYLDGDDKRHEVTFRRELIRTRTAALGGSLPVHQLQFESRSLSDDVGYIRFDNFSLPVIDEFCSSLTEMRDKKGIVIDLRGNIGGVIGVTVGLAGMLSDKPIEIGTALYRDAIEALASQPKAKFYKGRIVILVDDLSVSAAEMFASALQESNRALVVGDRSAGESLPSISVPLPTGATLLYPIANFKTPRGKLLEGVGVSPDRPVKRDRASLLKGRDVQLDAAVSLIADEAAFLPRSAGPTELKGVVNGAVITSSTAPPPPPPPASGSSGTGTATTKLPPAAKRKLLSVDVPPPPAAPEPPKIIEPQALAVIKRFEELTGGAKTYASIESYQMTGSIEITRGGSRNVFRYNIYKSGNEKYSEVLDSPTTGVVKDIRDGKTIHVKADWGMEKKSPFEMPLEKTGNLALIIEAVTPERYSKLLYLGEFERDGRRVHLIDGETKEGVTVAIYFDSQTKMLAGYEGPYGGITFNDFRTVDGVWMPFHVINHGSIDIKFDAISLNQKLDPSLFEHKQNCYDRPE